MVAELPRKRKKGTIGSLGSRPRFFSKPSIMRYICIKDILNNHLLYINMHYLQVNTSRVRVIKQIYHDTC